MSIETNLNITPYFDDYDELKQFYKILFKPSVAVQVRELNQLQSILQNQIERFGNHIFKNGTIVSGINFEYIANYPYVKIRDINTSDQPVDLQTYANYWVRNSSNLVAKVVNYRFGVESNNPNLNTLYLKYLNSGINGNTSQYSNGETLTVYSIFNPVFRVDVYSGGSDFSNSDNVVVTSAITVNVTSGSFATNDIIEQTVGANTARATIVAIDTTTLPGQTIFKIKPRTDDLSNASATDALWTFANNVAISNSTKTAVITSLIGSGAAAEAVTDGAGIVQSIQMTSGGSNYTVPPTITIQSVDGNHAQLNCIAVNYLTQITVANSSFTDPVGSGYAFATTEGIIYLKGHFLKADPGVVIVSKYSKEPDELVVGFDADESVVTSSIDTSLLDNATGAPNYTAPGANRLKITPKLVVLSKADAETNTTFLPLVEYSEGGAYKENRVTVYNTLSKEFERRTLETVGDFVIDPFDVTTREKLVSTSNNWVNTSHFQVVLDPGLAYISGARIDTKKNTIINVERGTATANLSQQLTTMRYGSYVLLNEMRGTFDTSSANTAISLRDTARLSISNTSLTSIGSVGNEIGTARVRSFQLNSGVQGSSSAVYELYLFDISMNAGKSFKDVKSIFSTGNAVGDCVLETDASTGASVAVLKESALKRLVFPTGFASVNSISNTVFNYKVNSNDEQFDANGSITIDITALSGETFPYSDGSLSSSEKEEITIVPAANLQASANLAGTYSVTNNVLTGTGTNFINDLRVNEFVKIANATSSQVFRISSIGNTTSATVSSNATTMNAQASANGVLFFPAFVPLNFTTRTNRAITISSSGKILVANLNIGIASGVNAHSVFNVKRTNTAQVTKTVYRDCYVKLQLSNNATTNTGPWCLGVPDAIRLKNVYVHNSSTVNVNSFDVTKHFYIESGQDSSSYKLAQLVKLDKTNLSLTTSDFLLVKFDVLQHSVTGGYKTISSYSINDTKPLNEATSTVNRLEVPDFGSNKLTNLIDFRPIATATATVTNVVASATLNPANTISYDSAIKYFPVPDGEFVYNVDYYIGRKDRVVLNRDGNFAVIKGDPTVIKPVAPKIPFESMPLAIVDIPPYPSYGYELSNTISTLASVRLNTSNKNKVLNDHTINTETGNIVNPAQPRQYTMKDILKLENRIKALEYQASLNAIESEISRINIPSGLNPTISRYKNGFFVDSFINHERTNTMDKQFSATIDVERGELQPREVHLNLQMEFDRTDTTTNNGIQSNTLLLPYTEVALIYQSQVTTAVVTSTPAVVPDQAIIPSVTPTAQTSPVTLPTTPATQDSDAAAELAPPPPDPIVKFVGEAIINPPSFNIEAMLEQSVTINLEFNQNWLNEYGSQNEFSYRSFKRRSREDNGDGGDGGDE